MNGAARDLTLSENVTVIEHGGRTFYIVGTAHISQKSVEEVRAVIARVQPDTVCIELDATRYETLLDDSRWRKMDIFQIIRQRKVLLLIASLALSAYQRRLGDKLGVRPGAEMIAAIEAAKAQGAELVLADRDIQATLKRTWRNLSFWNKIKIIGSLMATSGGDELTEADLEKMKEQDTLNELMKEFAREMPQLQVPLIDERDRYLMASVLAAPGEKVVAVVGAGHVEGIARYFGDPVDREALCVIPPPSRWIGLLKWIIPTLMLAAFYWGYQKQAGKGLAELVFAWVLPNAVVAGVFSLIAGARLISAAVAVVASPITSLNPTIGAGMVVGLVEAWLRRPTVEDCERVADDAQSVRGIYRNRFTRVLLVAVAATLGSAIGAWIGAVWVVALL